MVETSVFLQYSLVYLLAAVIAVPLSSRLGLGSVLGYLVAGAVIGPYLLNWVGDPADVMHAAEFGVVLMLFIIGLELQPHLLIELRRPILVCGSLQVAGTALVMALVLFFLSFTWQQSVAIGLIFSLSSTAIVLQSLAEKGLLKTEGGTHIFGVLLFQDIAIIPLLSILPLLGADLVNVAIHPKMSAWHQAGLVLVVAVVIVVAGRVVVRPVFRYITQSRLRELSIAAALLIVFASAYAMQWIELSPALGTFLAGLMLADSEYRHELEASIEPFKGLLLGLFFITVGASIDFALLWAKPLFIVAGLLGLITIKLAVLWAIAYYQKLSAGENSLFAFSLAQGGEFAFVLLAVSQQYGIVDHELRNGLVLIVALSMALTPILMLINEYLIQPRLQVTQNTPPPLANFTDKSPVLILGFGRFGQMVGRVLSANGFAATVIDHDAAQIDFVSKFGFKVYYGDAARLDLLRAAGIEQAQMVVVAIEEVEQSLLIVDLIKKNFPQVQILARARNRTHAYELMSRGVTDIFRDTFGSAMDMSTELLVKLGFRRYQAMRAGYIFRRHDEMALRDMFPLWQDEKSYISRSKQIRQQLEYALTQDRQRNADHHAQAWHSSHSGSNESSQGGSKVI
jgi:monovalent cation:proton antiporter-2 (CPA2) family protein